MSAKASLLWVKSQVTYMFTRKGMRQSRPQKGFLDRDRQSFFQAENLILVDAKSVEVHYFRMKGAQYYANQLTCLRFIYFLFLLNSQF